MPCTPRLLLFMRFHFLVSWRAFSVAMRDSWQPWKWRWSAGHFCRLCCTWRASCWNRWPCRRVTSSSTCWRAASKSVTSSTECGASSTRRQPDPVFNPSSRSASRRPFCLDAFCQVFALWVNPWYLKVNSFELGAQAGAQEGDGGTGVSRPGKGHRHLRRLSLIEPDVTSFYWLRNFILILVCSLVNIDVRRKAFRIWDRHWARSICPSTASSRPRPPRRQRRWQFQRRRRRRRRHRRCSSAAIRGSTCTADPLAPAPGLLSHFFSNQSNPTFYGSPCCGQSWKVKGSITICLYGLHWQLKSNQLATEYQEWN